MVRLLANAPKGTVLFNPLITDGEALQFSEQIKDTLSAAGYKVGDVPMRESLMGLGETGTFLWIKNRDLPPERAKYISGALRRIGIGIWAEVHPDLADNDQLIIVVGSHP